MVTMYSVVGRCNGRGWEERDTVLCSGYLLPLLSCN
ncbi:hypothetical protein JMJ77_0005105 [Colletotrichum scovillei]|uniref:Uncharacterized protein n=1 Tax=Colletotrichum scovillei TaxID=1209932 RepID=A0A9P7RFU6_9PEZI|nr:hypothetical protein JMJ77_0005105 [Colletotrichum scovillei]KAG7076257.1 hypothetical protein JMJ76_0013523 [Colletotrichum scovillei]KAG7083367.1 hypothetical protein JMJ78_0008813 [Colletotrichum scovillei]